MLSFGSHASLLELAVDFPLYPFGIGVPLLRNVRLDGRTKIQITPMTQ
ncbi:hypothetical protein I4300191C4_07040 [Solibaculum mannosilyticum]